jgi:tetratricopeptide (TPR) repeat protein
MADATSQHLLRGHEARGAGRSAEALGHYRAAVDDEPGSAEANSVYGLMLLQLGRADEAEAPLRKAVEIAPRHPALRMNLAQWLAQENRTEEAAAIVAGVVKDEPQHWWAWDRLGELKARQRDFAEAAACFERASELKPQDPGLLFKLAQSRLDEGRQEEGERVRAQAESLAQPRVALFGQHAQFHEARSNWAALERTARAWIAVHPRDPHAWRSLAKAMAETGYYGRAMDSFRQALDFGVRDARNLATFGNICMAALDYEAAAKALDEAEALDPECDLMLSAKATLLMVSGRYDEAQSYCRRAIGKDHSDVSAWKALVQLTGGRLSQEEILGLESLIERADLRQVDRVTAAYVVADCREAQGTARDAFVAFDRANRLAREAGEATGIRYDAAARRARTDEIISLFDSVPAKPDRDSGPRFVFIVGMPRSGTTLIESVIGAHSKVLACRERMPMRWVMEEYLALARACALPRPDAGAWKQWRRQVWEGVPSGHGAAVVTDKNPWNFDAIGLILRLFPDARIIHARRGPMDTGLSIYRNQFSMPMQFANRLEDIGHYYGEYARLMSHWERVAAGRFTTIQYERLIGDFDGVAPALLAACGLEWEPGCRNFWESRRVIGTISTMRARRPLEMRAGLAGEYAIELEPLAAALQAAGVDLETGALREDFRPA